LRARRTGGAAGAHPRARPPLAGQVLRPARRGSQGAQPLPALSRAGTRCARRGLRARHAGGGEVRTAFAGGLLLVALATLPVPARAEVIGVLILPAHPQERSLADNLAEVAMARIPETPGRTLMGATELRRRLGEDGARGLAACTERPECLSRSGVSMGIRRLLAGAVRGEKDHFFLSMTLADLASGNVEGRFVRDVNGSVADLIRAVQDGVDQVLDQTRIPGRLRVVSNPPGGRVVVDDQVLGNTPLLAGSLAPGRHTVRVELERRFAWKSVVSVPAGRDLVLELGERELPPRRTWAPYAAYGTATGAVLCAATGGLMGALARVPPAGQTR